MTNLNPSMRLKVKGDVFFLPDPNGGVYFRNNSVSFRIKGREIDQWIEKLMPVFNGEYTLGDITEGLPEPYQRRVYEIAEMLYQNGFVRDVSQDRPHQLPDQILQKYAPQIEFLDQFGDSGAYRFQCYRQAKVLAVGSGEFLVSLVAALFESGLPRFHVLITDSNTSRQRLEELEAYARKTDPEAELKEIPLPEREVSSWREAVHPFDAILYVSQEGNVKELKFLHALCREEKKVFLPAMFFRQAGLAGPVVHPDYEGCWESAWRRIHRSALCKDPQLHTCSSTAGAMLANVITFEWFKTATGVIETEGKNKFFLLNLETLEGNWHPFMPHPLVTGCVGAKWIQDLDLVLGQSASTSEKDGLLSAFSLLTAKESGIFHIWEEGDLKQLPLAQCRVQAADPLSEGPAELLSDMVCTGLTHEEARREAGLAGIEAYVSRLAVQHGDGVVGPQEFVGVGAGETVAEGVIRGLQKCLARELGEQQVKTVYRVQLNAIEDERCLFYLRVLSTMQGVPVIALGEEVSGFPVVWVGAGSCWYGGVDLNVTLALRRALQQALSKAQNPEESLITLAMEAPNVIIEEKGKQSLVIPACEEAAQLEVLRSALGVLKRNGRRLLVLEYALEPFLKEKLAGVFGVLLREEESR